MSEDHGLPIIRACQAARLSRAAYYNPGMDPAVRDAEVITALQAIVVEEQRWGFWKCRTGYGHKAMAGITSESGGCTASYGSISHVPGSRDTRAPAAAGGAEDECRLGHRLHA
jgi:hypothetical protein